MLSEVARLRRIGEPAEAIKKLRSNLPMDLAEAKIFVVHLNHEPGFVIAASDQYEEIVPLSNVEVVGAVILTCKKCQSRKPFPKVSCTRYFWINFSAKQHLLI